MTMDEKRMVGVVRVVAVLVLLYIGIDLGASVVRLIYYKQFVLAAVLEIIAAVALAIAHAIINVETGCAPVPRQLNVNWNAIPTLICFLFSWFTFAAASLSHLGSAVFDLGYFRHIMKVKPIFFHSSTAGLSSICCLGFDLAYYILYSANTTSSTAQVNPPNQADIELEQPNC